MVTDNRLHPRVKTDFEAEVLPSIGGELKVPVVNISIAGLMIRATQRDFNQILSAREQLEQSKPTELHIQFNIPHAQDGSGSVCLKIYCRAIYVRRKSQNHYIIGFKFLDMTEADEAVIQQYVRQQLTHL